MKRSSMIPAELPAVDLRINYVDIDGTSPLKYHKRVSQIEYNPLLPTGQSGFFIFRRYDL